MVVTQHARYTALFQLLRQNWCGVLGTPIALPALEQAWTDGTGLRIGDLHQSLEELIAEGCATSTGSDDDMLVTLSDRGMLKMNAWQEPLGLLAWLGSSDLSLRINTIRVLAQARARQQSFRLSLGFGSPSPIRDRRRLNDRPGLRLHSAA